MKKSLYHSVFFILIIATSLFAQYTGGSGDGFAVATTSEDISLPVNLVSYSYSVSGNAVKIVWETGSEVNNLGFIVFRKEENEDFQIINSYNQDETLSGLGNSSYGEKYKFTDSSVKSYHKYDYLIQSVDFSGHETTVFQINNISIENNITDAFTLKNNYPNPFNSMTVFPIEVHKKSNLKISIYSTDGRLVKILTNKVFDEGTHYITFNASGAIASGVYIVNVEGHGYIKNMKIINIK
jgi:hypothetical protein